MKLPVVAFLAALALSSVACASTSDDTASGISDLSASASTPITLANWISHAKIVAVRNEVNAIDAAKYASESKELCGGGVGESERTKLVDGNGTLRKYVTGGGSEDSAGTTTLYFDARGTVRFQFTTRSDVHGNTWEDREYYSETGDIFWMVTRHAFDEKLNADITKSPYEAPEEGFVPTLDGVTKSAEALDLWNAPENCAP